MNTKEKILDIALTLFSTKGYESVSIRDIAKQVGIKESSIYNHYTNKQDIFDSIMIMCQNRMMEHYKSMNLDQTLSGDFTVYNRISPNLLRDFALDHFKFYVSDDIMSRYRKLLTIEQFNIDGVGKIYRNLFIDQPINHQTRLFGFLIENKALKGSNPEAMAYEFYAPIFLMMSRYDDLTPEAERLLTQHLVNFVSKNT
jgi:AcrR family transcriptional regulator